MKTGRTARDRARECDISGTADIGNLRRITIVGMEDLAYNAVIPTLFRAVPEAKDAYGAWDMPGDPLPYIVFSFLEESFITPAVDAGDAPELLMRIFAFLERMSLSRDEEVVSLLWIGLFEAWAARPPTLVKAVERMGPATRRLASQAFQRITGRDLASMS